MVTKDQFLNGVTRYVDNSILPKLPAGGKWVVGSVILLMQPDKVYETLVGNPIIQMTNVVMDNGMIDIDRLAEAVKVSAEHYGNLEVTFPLVGRLTFSKADVEELHRYICGGGS